MTIEDYYNTNNEKGVVLQNSRRQARTQQERIRMYMQCWPNRLFTPFEIQEQILSGTPITSIRRAMTNLTDDGHLIKTDTKKVGKYGKANHTWKYNFGG
jgi:hypothetical protein